MINYTVNIPQPLILNANTIATPTRDPLIWKVLLPWVGLFLIFFLIFKHFLIKFIENAISKERTQWRCLIVSLIFFSLLIVMVIFAIHYGPIDLMRPISSLFGIK